LVDLVNFGGRPPCPCLDAYNGYNGYNGG